MSSMGCGVTGKPVDAEGAAILPQAGGCGNPQGLTGCLKPHHASQIQLKPYSIDDLEELPALEAGAATQIGQLLIHVRGPCSVERWLGWAARYYSARINIRGKKGA